MASFPIGVFGKLPCHGDFLRYGDNTVFPAQWDRWLQDSIDYCQTSLGREPWLSTYLTSPLWRFMLHKGLVDQQVYTGFMIPSVDAVGRYFPLVVYVTLDSDAQVQAFISQSARWFTHTEHVVLSLLEKEDGQVSDIYPPLHHIMNNLDNEDYLPPFAAESTIAIRSTTSNHAAQIERWYQLSLTQKLPQSLWWTDGSEQLQATTLSLETLPAPDVFLAMMDGQWNRSSLESGAILTPSRIEDNLNVSAEQTSQDQATPPAPAVSVETGNERSYGISHPGHVRRTNEDLYLNEPHRQLWAVADGMGGHSRGDIASYKLVEALAATPLSNDIPTAINMIRQTVMQVNKELYTLSDNIIGTTLALLYIVGEQAVCLWVGDSRIYRLDHQGVLQPLTRDHSESDGTENDDDSAMLTHAIGAEEQTILDQNIVTCSPGERFLICSDGIYNAISHTQIQTVLQEEISPKYACKELTSRVLATAATDNLTAIVIDC